ncbi:toxin ArtA [Escherichia coli]|uniref:toxin ArtA n=1 Tax=Escherichia coli TaxID=562 RepID=UPI00202303AA|nr:toxin ArtA [Escherichia coli]
MKKLSFKEKLEIVRNIIRESLSGNAAFALLVYSLLHSLPIKTFADLFVAILLFIAIIAVVIWLFLIIYVDNIIQTNILLKLSNFVITGMVLTAIETTGTAH